MKKKYPSPKDIPDTGRLRVCVEKVKEQHLKNKVLVDVGCSNGWLADRLEKLKLKAFIGIDPSNEAVSDAKKNAPYAKFFVANADDLPIKDKIADIVTMFDVIEHVPAFHEADALGEASRVLKKGGKLLLSTPNNNILTNLLDPVWYFGHRHYRPQELKKMITLSGFKVEKIEVRGGIWFSIYLLWIYVLKRLLKYPLPRNQFLEKKDDIAFNKKGIHTIYVIADKK